MAKIIHLFRHGQTDWNVGRRLQGHTDIPLNDEGRKQAETLQAFFKENPVDLFFASDLSRAQETASIANSQIQVPLHTSPNFREVCLGEIEGLTYEEILHLHGEEAWARWQSIRSEDFDFSFKDGETAFAAIARFEKGLLEICQKHDFSVAGLCTHGLMIRRYIHRLRPEIKEPIPVPNCSVFTIHWDKDKGFFY